MLVFHQEVIMPCSTSKKKLEKNLKNSLIEKSKEFGFDVIKITKPNISKENKDYFDKFLFNNFHGEMDWLENKKERRKSPKKLWSDVESIIMLGVNYGPDHDPLDNIKLKNTGNISVYAKGNDYHDIIKKNLKKLGRWFVQEIKSETVKDYILLLFMTGLRRQEGFKLKWADVDLKGRTFTISETKNKNPLALPMGKFTYDIFKRRKEGDDESQYVFPGSGKTGHLVEPKKQVSQVFNSSGVKFCLHDLRRGFITTAESLDISSYAMKAMVNHALKGDVTGGYIVIDPERLREPMQRIEDHLLKLCRGTP